jgi:hypothetical protein
MDRTAMPLATLFNADDFYLRQGVDVNRLGTFLGNHDMGRVGAFISLNRGQEIALKQNELAHALLYTLRGTPIVYYGDEFGLMGGNDKNARQDLFATEVLEWQSERRIGMEPIGKGDSFSKNNPLQNLLRELSGIRSKYGALSNGSQQIHYAGAGWLVFSRIDPTDGHVFLAAFNSNDESSSLQLPYILDTKWAKIAGAGTIDSSSSQVDISLPGISWVLFRSDQSLPSRVDSLTITKLRIDPLDNSRFEIAAKIVGQGAYEVLFQYRDKNGLWKELGTDLSPTFSKNAPDNGLYRVFPARSALPKVGTLTVRALIRTTEKERVSPERVLTLKK